MSTKTNRLHTARLHNNCPTCFGTDGLEFTKTAMLLSLVALPLNVFLNWIMIYGNWGFPRMELVGAGYATLITRILIFVVLMLIILYHSTFMVEIA